MPDQELVITHLQIIHTWAEFARERDLQFFTAKHLEDIAQWSKDAISLLKEKDAEVELCERCGRVRLKSKRERRRSRMNDREQIMSWLEGLAQDDWMMFHSDSEVQEIARNSLALLKEQEAITVDTKVIGTFNGDVEVYCCRYCRTILDPAFHYCPNCGKAVKWNDQ